MIGCTARIFCRMPLGTTRAFGFMASIATGEAKGDTGDARGNGGGGVLAFCRLEAETAALTSATVFFLDEAHPRFFIILKFFQEKKGALALRGKDEKSKINLRLEYF